MQAVACPRCATSLSYDPASDGPLLMCPWCGQQFTTGHTAYFQATESTQPRLPERPKRIGVALPIAAVVLLAVFAAGAWAIANRRETLEISIPIARSNAGGKVVFAHNGWGDGKTPVFHVGDKWRDEIEVSGSAFIRQYTASGKLVHTYHPDRLGSLRYGGFNDKGGDFYFEIEYLLSTGPWSVTVEQH